MSAKVRTQATKSHTSPKSRKKKTASESSKTPEKGILIFNNLNKFYDNCIPLKSRHMCYNKLNTVTQV